MDFRLTWTLGWYCLQGLFEQCNIEKQNCLRILGWHGLQLLFKQYYIEKQVLSVDMDFTYINITYDITNKIQLTLGWHVIVGNLLELFWQTVCFMTWCPAILVVICSHCPAKISLPKSLIDTGISGRYFCHFFFFYIFFVISVTLLSHRRTAQIKNLFCKRWFRHPFL